MFRLEFAAFDCVLRLLRVFQVAEQQHAKIDEIRQTTCRGTWKMLDYKGAPQVEGHKAVASGLDIFTFGGHKLLGKFEGPDVAVYKLLGRRLYY